MIMRIKYIFILITGFIVFTNEAFCQQDDAIVYITQLRLPRCGEVFPLSYYEGEMILSEKINNNPLCDTTVRYTIDLYERDLVTNSIAESYPNGSIGLNPSDKYKNIYFGGNMIDLRTITGKRLILTQIPQNTWQTYYIDPVTGRKRLIKSMNFERGIPCGDYTVWSMEGDVLYRTSADTLGSWIMKDYYPSGKIRAEGEYLNGKRNGNWKWYDEKGRKIVEELYLEGKHIKRLIPFDVTLSIQTNSTEIRHGFVILENEDDGSSVIEPVFWNDIRTPVLQLRDTAGINLYFCIFGHAPLQLKISDAGTTIDKKRTMTVKPVQSVVHIGKMLWARYPVNVNADLSYNYFNLPPQVNIEYGLANYRYNNYSSVYNCLKQTIPFHDIMPVLNMGESLDLHFHISGNNTILKIAGYSKSISSKRLDSIILYLQYLQGKQMSMYNIDYRNDYTYTLTIQNTIDYPVSVKKKQRKWIKKR